MASQVEAALEQEIREVEARIALTADGAKLSKLRKMLADYRGLPNEPATRRASPALRPDEREAAPSRRARSPERQAVIDAAATFLRGKPYPIPTRTVFEALQATGVYIPGNNPQNNLSAMLSNARDIFKSHGREGWTLAENENPADAEHPGQDGVNGGVEDQGDTLIEPSAQGREADVPGGGT